MRYKISGPYQVVFLVSLLKACICHEDTCDRRPLKTDTAALPPDNRFVLEVVGLRGDRYDYIPGSQYTVRLSSRDMETKFIAFTISLREDTTENKNNRRRPLLLKAGTLEPLPYSNNTKMLTTCNNTVIQSDITPKVSVEAIWTAPPKGNKCVTIYAVVAVSPDVWYSYEGPLSKHICEDRRKADDMLPTENENCEVCEDARYQLTFEGKWSFNTHPAMYPPTHLVARFSDVVGASHSKDFTLFKYNSEASAGLKLLAEQGNTTNLEVEIYEQLGTDVRTILKATAPPQPNMNTLTTFRATRKHHMVSIATAIMPSPDWFLGVANLELCDAQTNEWATNITYNLYPMDAGTDSGLSFDSSNDATAPQQPIASAKIGPQIPQEHMKPFARLVFRLIRTYYNPNCSERTEVTVPEGESDDSDTWQGHKDDEDTNIPNVRPRPTPPTITSEEPPVVDPESSPECPVTPWEDWQQCEGDCIDGKVIGYKVRMRYTIGDLTPECLKVSLIDTEPCEDECEEEIQEEEEDDEGDQEEE